jgi:hypothetical protein
MADILTLGDVSTKDTGSGSKLKTGGRRQHNMPKSCVKKKMKEGMTQGAAIKACYPNMKKLDMKKIEGRLKKLENPRKSKKSSNVYKPTNKRKTTPAERKHLLSGRKMGY